MPVSKHCDRGAFNWALEGMYLCIFLYSDGYSHPFLMWRLQIRGRGAIAIAKAVAQLPHMQSLLLDENELSDAAIAGVKVSFYLPRLFSYSGRHC